MKSNSYMCPLIFLPAIITEPGQYRTRRGEVVTIFRASNRLEFGCDGTYPEGTTESWHKSGRLYANCESRNDIIARECKSERV